jgi:hypothetical protein
VLPWPLEGAPGPTRINGRKSEWRDRELRITRLPALVTIK